MQTPQRGRVTAAPVRFAADLEDHGEAIALVSVDGRAISYRELAASADHVTHQLGTTRRLVLLEAGDDQLDAIVGLLGALRGGHVVLLTGAGGPASDRLLDAYDPDVVLGGGQMAERRPGSTHDLHPELALLLSTSGSTGSPKLVRLSAAGIDANAHAIASYLGLTADDRAITTLPLQYCYGLSVITSHLTVGASIVCSDASVVDPCFWTAVDRQGVTNLAGVPHTFELLERSGFSERRHPSLRFLTQAGGRLAPEQVRRFARLGGQRGFELFVMYGQTEATARMAYLPPALAERHPDAVGVAVPGGAFRLDPIESGDDGEGELVYTGPNVMLGYAENRDDLALGRVVDELRTGDIARIDDGLVRIVGRAREILKVFGLRIDLRRVRTLLAARGIDATCAGDDDGLAIAVHDRTPLAHVRATLADIVDLPPSAVAVAPIAGVPRLPNGKVDVPALVGTVRRAAERDAGEDRRPGTPVSAVLGTLLGVDPRPEQTFVSMGGDSLTYVEASIRLEEQLGHLPDGWHVRTMAELDRLDGASDRRGPVVRVETGVLLRAVAIVLVVGSHTGAFLIGGGAHLLFAAAGFNMARFQLRSGGWGRSLARFLVPSVLWIGGAAALTDGFDLAHVGLVHSWIGGSGRWAYWFVEALAQVLVASFLLLRVPAVRRFERRHPFAFPSLLLAPALAVRFDLIDFGPHRYPFFRPHEIAWIFLLGWLAASARSTGQRAGVTAVALLAIPGFFDNPTRENVLLGGLLLLLWVPSLPVPRGAPRLLGVVAAASLHVYLSHVQVHPLVSPASPIAALAVSLVAGIVLWRLTQPVQQHVERWFSTRSCH
jgi:hypothetical protein